jgi:hypothetical protein
MQVSKQGDSGKKQSIIRERGKKLRCHNCVKTSIHQAS